MADRADQSWMDTLKERLRELAEAVGDLLGPRPQRVPVPVRPDRRR